MKRFRENLNAVGGIHAVDPRTVMARWKKDGGSGGAEDVRLYQNGKLAAQPIFTVPDVAPSGEGGLMSITGSPPLEDLAAAVYHETEGNPFFVEEVLKALIEQGSVRRESGRWKRCVGRASPAGR